MTTTTIPTRYDTITFTFESDDRDLILIADGDPESRIEVPWPTWIFRLDEEIKNYEPLVSEMIDLLQERFDADDITVTRNPATYRDFVNAVKRSIEPGPGGPRPSFRAYRRLGDFREVHLSPRSTVTAHPGTMVVTIDDDISREGSREDQVPSIRVHVPGETVHLTWGEARMLRDSLDEILGVAING